MNSLHDGQVPMPLSPAQDPAEIPDAVVRLVATFRDALADVGFPDVSLQALGEAIEAVHRGAAGVAAARAQLADAEQELGQSRDALQRLAERALAYAKVYAAGDGELSKRLDAIDLAEAPKRKRRKGPDSAGNAQKRGRSEARPQQVAASSDERSGPQLVAVG